MRTKETIKNKFLKNAGAFNRTVQLCLIISFCAFLTNITLMGQETAETSDSSKYIKGVVRDANTQQPIPAARIQSLNHEAVTTTGEDGSFTIETISEAGLLRISAYDYNTRDVAVRGKQNLEIDLYPEKFTSKYEDMAGIIGPDLAPGTLNAIKQTNNPSQPTMVAADEAIQNDLLGHARVISRSGNPGYGSTIFLRGLNSLLLNAQPLLVVDNVFWNNYDNYTSINEGYNINSLADIDVNDIENIQVLKDGTSLYGSKGSNGVIIINTKRGREMATKIEVNAVGGFIEHPKSLPTMNGEEFKLYTTDLLGTFDAPADIIDEQEYLNDDPSSLEYNKYHNVTDWDKEVYQQGLSQSYNISVNGGDERALYAFSMGYTGVNGMVKSTDMNRLNTRFNADFFLSDKINTALNIGFTNIDRNLLDDGVNFYTSPTYMSMIKAPFLNPYSYTTDGTLTEEVEDSDIFNVGNPTAIIQNSLNTNKHYRLNLGLRPEFQIGNSIWLSTQFDYSLDKMKETFYRPIVGSAERYIEGLGYSENVFKSMQTRNMNIFDDTRLTFKQQFGYYHRINAVAGWRYIVNYYEADYAEGHNSGSEQKRNLLFEEEFKKTSGANDRTKSISNYANINYSYDNRYFLTLSAAIDASSRFGKETQGGLQLFDQSWGVFPGAQAAWLISSEKFMANAAFIDHLKLRAGYSITGNDAIKPYARSPYFTSVQYMDRANGIVLENVANTEIQWETTAKMNVGVDVHLLNNRLSLTADVYNNYTKDLLTLQSYPEIVGEGLYLKNGGELSNKGFEVSANIKVMNTSFFKWEFGTSIGHYKNNIEALPNGSFTTSYYNAQILSSVGNPAGVFYGYKTKGVFTSYAEAEQANLKLIDEDGNEHYFEAGDIHFEEVLADGIIDKQDRQIIGDPNPDLYGSVNNHFTLGNFTVGAIASFSYGNDVYNYLRAVMESGSDFRNQTTAVLNRWTYEGQETDQPKAVYGDPMGNSRFSDRWIEDGSYIRIKKLSVGYEVPIQRGFFEGINVWAAVNNLWTFTNYLGRDPEVSPHSSVLFQGIDTGLIPVSKSYHLGIKLNL